MKRIIAFALIAFGFVFATISLNGCKKDSTNNNDKVTKTGIPLEPAQEGAGIVSSGSGTVDIDYTKSTKVFNYTVKWSGLTGPATAMHFHGPAARGASAAPVIPVQGFTSAASGTYSGTATLTAAQEADLLANKWYFNIHTSTYPGGEIRGQIEF
jgi:hypothetical protein